MSDPLVDVVIDGPVATLTLDRPEARNALSLDLCNAIVSGLEEIDASAEARVVVLRGKGAAFCAGADLAAVSGPGAGDFLPGFERMLEATARFRLPTVAMIHGAALGGGLQLATVCDLRFCSDDARLGIPSPHLGIVVNFENVERLVGLVGIPSAKYILMTGRALDGAEAERVGLVHASFPPDALEEETYGYAAEIGTLAPLSVQGAKRAIQVVTDNIGSARAKRPRDVEEIDRLVVQAYSSEDLAEGMRARAEKRSPRFEGR